MSRIFITGSSDGLGRAAARALMNDGHQVILHSRSEERTSAFRDLAPRSATVVVGDLTSAVETRRVAEQVNAIGRMHAVIHNAGTYLTSGRAPTPEGHATILAVNTLAPYMLTALIDRPDRLIYLSSDMHRAGVRSLRDIDWIERRWNSSQAYSESKLYVTDSPSPLRDAGPTFSVTRSIQAGSRRRWVAPELRTTSRWDTSPRPGSRPATIPMRESPAATGIIAARRRPPGPRLIRAFRTSSRPGSLN